MSKILIGERMRKARSGRSDDDKSQLHVAGAVPCRSCGLAVSFPEAGRVETMDVYGAAARSAYGRGTPVAPKRMNVTRCDDCLDRRLRAEALVTVHGLGRIYGAVAVDKLDAALAVFDMIGLRGDRTAALTRTPSATRELIEVFAPIGAPASWSANVIMGGDPEAAATKRWERVDAELARSAGHEYRQLIHRRTEVAKPFSPPVGSARGCLLCGIGSVIAKPSTASAAWGEQRQAFTGTLGGRTRPEPVTGNMCPECRKSVDEVGGSIGMAAVERAVLKTLGYRLPWGQIEAWPGVVAWAALKPGTPPNATPWAHLRLDSLERAVERDFRFQRDVKVAR